MSDPQRDLTLSTGTKSPTLGPTPLKGLSLTILRVKLKSLFQKSSWSSLSFLVCVFYALAEQSFEAAGSRT